MTPLNGLILTGGYSRRMGQDKALIDLEGMTLLDRTYNLLNPFIEQVYVSVRRDQINETKRAQYPLIIDQIGYSGPIAGILSAGDYDPHSGWLVVACDMPFLDNQTIDQLIHARNLETTATLFQSIDESGVEPLCAIYEPRFFSAISSDSKLIKNASPRETLSKMDLEILNPLNPDALLSANVSIEEITNRLG